MTSGAVEGPPSGGTGGGRPAAAKIKLPAAARRTVHGGRGVIRVSSAHLTVIFACPALAAVCSCSRCHVHEWHPWWYK